MSIVQVGGVVVVSKSNIGLNSTANLDAAASIISTNAENNRVFMLMNAAPSQCDALTAGPQPYGAGGPATCPPFTSAAVINGQAIFNNSATFTGCALCHTPNQTSGPSQQAAWRVPRSSEPHRCGG
jgi:hypothetical protein